MDGGSVIGHQSLIAARMGGYRPTDVWLTCLTAEHPAGASRTPKPSSGR